MLERTGYFCKFCKRLAMRCSVWSSSHTVKCGITMKLLITFDLRMKALKISTQSTLFNGHTTFQIPRIVFIEDNHNMSENTQYTHSTALRFAVKNR